ncbi:MAG TPA: hypothetical protein VGE84_03335 [Allosphingosinicella sp.]
MSTRNSVARQGVLFALLVGLASCAPSIIPPGPPQAPAPHPPPPVNAAAEGVRAGPALDALGLTDASAEAALSAFRISCPSLLKRADVSGLTEPSDWAAACTDAASWPAGTARAFFAAHFEAAVVGEGRAFATGYF